jgi:trehalose utilization protein
MYGEPFGIPQPEDTVFISWFEGGNVFRSGVTFRREYGRIFYFQPGHETYPTYHNRHVQRVIINAVTWARPVARTDNRNCPNVEALEKLGR